MDIYTSQLGCIDDIRKGITDEEEIYSVLNGVAAQEKTEKSFSDSYEPEDGVWIPNIEEKKIAHDFVQKLYELSPSLALVSESEEEFIRECKSFGRDLLSGETLSYGKKDLFDDTEGIYESFMGFYLEEHGERAGRKFLGEDYTERLIDKDLQTSGGYEFNIPRIETERKFREDGLVGKVDVLWEDDVVYLREIKAVKELEKDHILQTLGNAYLVKNQYPEEEVDCKIINFGFENPEEAVLDFTEVETNLVQELLDYGKFKVIEALKGRTFNEVDI